MYSVSRPRPQTRPQARGVGSARRPTAGLAQPPAPDELSLLQALWRRPIPALSIFLWIIPMSLPVFLPGPVLPHTAFLALFYWLAHRPDLLPVWVAFLLGLLVDAAQGQPLGLCALLFTLTALMMGGQAQMFRSRPFRFEWGMAILALALFQTGHFLLVLLVQPKVSALPFLGQFMASVLTVPAVAWVNRWVHVRTLTSR